MLREYYQLTKPGIIRGNLITAAGGFFLASRGRPDGGLFIAMMVGLALIIAAACVYNNYLDRGLDAHMKRTRDRALVTGAIRPNSALVFATGLLVLGTLILSLRTNAVTLLLALFGLVAYVVIYGYGKRASVHGTLLGTISGAVPPVVGYAAVTGRLDVAAGLLFIILVCWQMPHFYAIAMFRKEDYAAAGVPVLPVVKGNTVTVWQTIAYVAAFVLACALLTVVHVTGYVYLIVMLAVGLAWLTLAVKGLSTKAPERWARKVFGFSLVTILIFSVAISLDAYLP